MLTVPAWLTCFFSLGSTNSRSSPLPEIQKPPLGTVDVTRAFWRLTRRPTSRSSVDSASAWPSVNGCIVPPAAPVVPVVPTPDDDVRSIVNRMATSAPSRHALSDQDGPAAEIDIDAGIV